jgi:type I restriction enzyme M protein
MLDAETKRKIDNCRDVLVGKIPDPKSQVEQITIALIYKFMDDMDQLSVDQGGKPSFFRGEFEKYSWSSIFDPRIDGFQLLNLYGEALLKMNQNPNIPQLFRDIFKNAFLPYRDPETLRLFLKEIRGFTYDHSEKLGDAFEYLLSVLSSQGDAGQFRTPRHIIDFIVEVVAPQLNETVLDPACGTAGFLISAYKHILKNNPKLSTAQKKRLMNNFVGYDIDPGMRRLSLVNMYLHRFPEPHIHEYDTLTSEDRWQDTFDVIMANPPFMSPKGGIRPHSRFSIPAKRSEVLFVDYIAEHLNPSGRAAIIVPEGIIFISQNAYKSLRKMLVENYLWAVVSLPAGVFNPYSGTKTCILLLDKSLAKRIDKILFVKIENDGFDLGAQRRPIGQNDLPAAQKYLNIYKSKIENYKSKIEDSPIAHAVLKSEIAKSGDYNLTGDRYRSFEHHKKTEWPMVALGDICEIDPSKKHILQSDHELEVSFVPMADINAGQKYLNPIQTRILNDVLKGYTYFKDNDVLLAKITPCFENGKATIAISLKNGIGFGSTEFIVFRPSKRILSDLLYYFITRPSFIEQGANNMTGSAGQQRVRVDFVSRYKIPLPPLDVQGKIIAEIDSYQKIIDAARQIVENYKPSIKINPDWPMVEIGEKCKLVNGKAFKPSDWSRQEDGGLPIVRIQNLNNPDIAFNYYNKHIDPKYIIRKDDLLFSWSGSRGTSFGPHILTIDKGVLNQHIFKIIHSENFDRIFLYFALKSIVCEVEDNLHGGVGLVHITKPNFEKIKVPIPDIKEQKQIAEQIESEQKIVNENKKLIEIFENKISDTISALWA